MKKIILSVSALCITLLSANEDAIVCEKLNGLWRWNGSVNQWVCQGLNNQAEKDFANPAVREKMLQSIADKAKAEEARAKAEEAKIRSEEARAKAEEIKRFSNLKGGVLMCTSYLIGLNKELECSGDYTGKATLYNLLKTGWHIEAEMTHLTPMAIIFTKK